MKDATLTKDERAISHTQGPWEWWTSNSWKRLKRTTRGITQNVLEPYTCRDGQADLIVNEADMALIAAAPDMLEALLCLRPGLVLDLRYADDDDDKAALRSRIETVEAAIRKATTNV